jgi:AcrR family transcriptional regulator
VEALSKKRLLFSFGDTKMSQMISNRLNSGADPGREPHSEILVQAAAELARNPRASMDSIARACGIGRATLNRRFSSREDLMKAIALDAMRSLDWIVEEASGAASAAELLEEILPALIDLGDRFRVLDQAPELMDLPEIKEALGRQKQETIELARALKQEGALHPAVPDAFFAAALDGLLFSTWMAVAEGTVARLDAPRLVYRTLFQGLSTGR